MTKHLVYLVGPPGVGKSSVMAELTAGLHRVPYKDGQLRYDGLYKTHAPPQTATPVGVELGARRNSFSGTDALGMAVQPHAVDWIGRTAEPLVLGEGARLGNVGFLSAARLAGYTLHLVHMTADPRTLAARRLQRGSKQSPVWIRGAETRARRIMDRMELDCDALWLDVSNCTPSQAAATLLVSFPALEVLR